MKFTCTNPDHEEPYEFEMKLPIHAEIPTDRDIDPTILDKYFVCPDCNKSNFLVRRE